MLQPSIVAIDCQSLSPAIEANSASVEAKPRRPNKLCNERNVALFDAGTFGATATFNGAVINALGQLRSKVAIAAGMLTKKCIVAIIAI